MIDDPDYLKQERAELRRGPLNFDYIRSHFESMAIWHTARFDPEDRNGLGWIGRALDGIAGPARGGPASLFIGSGLLPDALPGRRAVAASLARPDDLVLPAGMRPKGAAAVPAQDLAAFVQRSALDAYATADRMAEVAAWKIRGRAIRRPSWRVSCG